MPMLINPMEALVVEGKMKELLMRVIKTTKGGAISFQQTHVQQMLQ